MRSCVKEILAVDQSRFERECFVTDYMHSSRCCLRTPVTVITYAYASMTDNVLTLKSVHSSDSLFIIRMLLKESYENLYSPETHPVANNMRNIEKLIN